MSKSPIERMLIDEIRTGHPGVNLSDCSRCGNARIVSESSDLHGRYMTVDSAHGHCDGVCIGSESLYLEALLYSNVKILSYRIDIVIEVTPWNLLAIECDGHDFHDRTKQQAAYDRSRDRELLKLGIPTIRFTGSEIHHSATRCADDIWQIVESFAEREARDIRIYMAGADSTRKKREPLRGEL